MIRVDSFVNDHRANEQRLAFLSLRKSFVNGAQSWQRVVHEQVLMAQRLLSESDS